jgi:hypothetical protein
MPFLTFYICTVKLAEKLMVDTKVFKALAINNVIKTYFMD